LVLGIRYWKDLLTTETRRARRELWQFTEKNNPNDRFSILCALAPLRETRFSDSIFFLCENLLFPPFQRSCFASFILGGLATLREIKFFGFICENPRFLPFQRSIFLLLFTLRLSAFA